MTFQLDPHSSASLAELIVIANTPHFLYKGLRKLPFVEKLSQSQIEDLLSEATELHNEREHLNEEVHLQAYALIGALSLTHGTKVDQALALLAALPIRWANELCEFARAKTLSDSAQVINVIRATPSESKESSTFGFIHQVKLLDSRVSADVSKPKLIVHP